MQILILWLLNPLQIYKHSPTKLVWLVRKLLLTESFTIQHIATTKDRVPFIVLSSYAVLPVRAYKRGARLQRTGRCRSVQRFFSENKNIGLLWAKVRRFCIKSTEVLCKEVRCFCSSETFSLSESRGQACLDYAERRKRRQSQRTHSPPTKIFFCWNLLHFLHPARKTPINPGHFGWRIGCRIPSTM